MVTKAPNKKASAKKAASGKAAPSKAAGKKLPAKAASNGKVADIKSAVEKQSKSRQAQDESARILLAKYKTEDFDAFSLYKEIIDITREQEGSQLLAMYELGAKLSTMFKRYERNGLADMATALALNADTCRKAVAFHALYAKKDVELAIKGGLTWSHFRLLAGVPDEKMRKDLEARAIQQNWGWRELTKAIQKSLGNRSNRTQNAGRSPKILANAIGNMATISGKWLTSRQNVWEASLFPTLASIGEGEVEAEVVEAALPQLEELKTNLDKMAEQIDADRERVVDAINAGRKIVDEKAEEQPAEAPAAEAEEGEKAEAPAKATKAGRREVARRR
jgi:hypothetical protein